MQRDLTASCTLKQHGIVEKKNRAVVEMTRNMTKEKGPSNNLWVEAMATAVYLLNISPTKAVHDITPFEA